MVTARYPYEVGGDQFWVGGKAGFHYDDFMVFTGCLQPGCVVSFDPLSMPGLGLGAELGAELDTLYFIGGYTHGLANFIMPYSSTVDANLGLEVIENGFVDLGFSWVARSILLQGVDSGMERGQLTDGQVIFKLGAGIAL